MKLIALALAFLLNLGSFAAGQQRRQDQRHASAHSYLFMVGATKAEIRSHFGPPHLIFSTAAQRYYPAADERIVASVGGAINDVYVRRSGGNTFRIEIQYGVDGTRSRLHPIERAADVHFIPDRAAPFSTLLNEIPEVIALCRDGCSLGGVIVASDPEVRVCREAKDPREIEILSGAASDWALPSDGTIWKYCAVVSFRENVEGVNTEPAWNDLTVDEIVIGPNQDIRSDKFVLDGDETGYDLGTWKPNS